MAIIRRNRVCICGLITSEGAANPTIVYITGLYIIDQSNQLSFRYHKRKDMILVVSINYRSRFIIVKFELCVIIEKLTINFFFVLILLYVSIVYHKWKIYNNCFFNKIITEKGMNISNREI